MAKKITLRDLEAACIEALGKNVYKAMKAGQIGMASIGDRAALICFLENQTGPHVEIIRKCVKELHDTGVYPFYKKEKNPYGERVETPKPAPRIRVPKDKPGRDPFLQGIMDRNK